MARVDYKAYEAVGELHTARLSEGTVRKYKKAVKGFKRWLAAIGGAWNTYQELDVLVDWYIHMIYRRDQRRSTCVTVSRCCFRS